MHINERRGSDRNVSIRYGVNLLSLSQSQNKRDFFTAVIPFWRNSETDQVVILPERVLYADPEYADVFREIPVDLSGEFDNAPTENELRDAARTWVAKNKLENPTDAIKISFVDLARTEEYKDVLQAKEVSLGDSIELYYPEFELRRKIRVMATVYNVLLDRYDSVDLGDLPKSFPQVLLNMNRGVNL